MSPLPQEILQIIDSMVKAATGVIGLWLAYSQAKKIHAQIKKNPS
jgi:hypothetical protein